MKIISTTDMVIKKKVKKISYEVPSVSSSDSL